jgi:hypothetical protein
MDNIPKIDDIKQGLGNGFNNIKNSVESTSNSLKSNLNEFSSQAQVSANDTFLNSNSLIAKFSFVILIVIAFLILLNLGSKLVFYFFQSPRNPYIVKGLLNGNANTFISQDPTVQKSIVLRSNNQKTGLEFTWSVWLNVHDQPGTKNFHVFHKGNNQFHTEPGTANDGIATINNAPGVYITQANDGKLSLKVIMDNIVGGAFSTENISLNIEYIPIKKWFHLAIRVQNTVMDVYINGVISGRLTFTNVPKQNYNDIFVGCNGGFNGELSDLIYYDHALTVFDINNIILKNPNLTKSTAGSNYGFYSYLSSDWYISKTYPPP